MNKSWVWQTKKGCAAANGFNDNQNILNVRILKKCDLVANLLPFEYRLALGLSTVLINLFIFRILNKRSPIDHSKCSELVVIVNFVIFSLPFLREFVSTVGWGTWIFTIKICWAKLYVKTVNNDSNDASFGACNHFSSLRDSVIKKSMCRPRRGWPGFQQGLTSKLSAQSSDRCYRTDFAGDASGEQAMQFANRTCDPKSVFRAIFAKEQILCCCYFGASLG